MVLLLVGVLTAALASLALLPVVQSAAACTSFDTALQSDCLCGTGGTLCLVGSICTVAGGGSWDHYYSHCVPAAGPYLVLVWTDPPLPYHVFEDFFLAKAKFDELNGGPSAMMLTNTNLLEIRHYGRDEAGAMQAFADWGASFLRTIYVSAGGLCLRPACTNNYCNVSLDACDSLAQWQFFGNRLFNRQTARCLDVPNCLTGTAGSKVQIATCELSTWCGSASDQVWSPGSGSVLVNVPLNLCLDGSDSRLRSCSAAATGQQFSWATSPVPTTTAPPVTTAAPPVTTAAPPATTGDATAATCGESAPGYCWSEVLVCDKPAEDQEDFLEYAILHSQTAGGSVSMCLSATERVSIGVVEGDLQQQACAEWSQEATAGTESRVHIPGKKGRKTVGCVRGSTYVKFDMPYVSYSTGHFTWCYDACPTPACPFGPNKQPPPACGLPGTSSCAAAVNGARPRVDSSRWGFGWLLAVASALAAAAHGTP